MIKENYDERESLLLKQHQSYDFTDLESGKDTRDLIE